MESPLTDKKIYLELYKIRERKLNTNIIHLTDIDVSVSPYLFEAFQCTSLVVTNYHSSISLWSSLYMKTLNIVFFCTTLQQIALCNGHRIRHIVASRKFSLIIFLA